MFIKKIFRKLDSNNLLTDETNDLYTSNHKNMVKIMEVEAVSKL
ncbi:hypothetical protein N9H64_04480 [Acidimicrobiia bacterium]|nr:hypothetical protein [Acidimicrobiia bacterium]